MTVTERLCSADVAQRLAAVAEMAERDGVSGDELHALGQCLGHEKKVVQRRAAEAFAALNEHGVPVQEILAAALASTTPRQQWGAAFALSLLGVPPPETLPVLLACLGSDDGDVRWAAANILVGMKQEPHLVEALQATLHSGNAAQRKMAAYCLRDLDARLPRVEQAMFDALNDTDAGVRMAAMSSLARLSADRATVAERLIALLDDADQGVRRAAAAVLGAVGEASQPVVAALCATAASSDASLRRAAERSLRLLASTSPSPPRERAGVRAKR